MCHPISNLNATEKVLFLIIDIRSKLEKEQRVAFLKILKTLNPLVYAWGVVYKHTFICVNVSLRKLKLR